MQIADKPRTTAAAHNRQEGRNSSTVSAADYRLTTEQFAARHGIKVNRRHILPEELSTFTEAFLVGTAAEVTPISEIGEYRFTPAKISELLMHAYLDDVQPKKVAAAE